MPLTASLRPSIQGGKQNVTSTSAVERYNQPARGKKQFSRMVQDHVVFERAVMPGPNQPESPD
jgi:hypothetical protein